MPSATPIPVSEEDARVLCEWARSVDVTPALTRRARIVLLAAEGLGPAAIATRLGCTKQTAILWRERFRVDGLDGLRDAPRSGRPTTVDDAAVVARTLEPPPDAAARWTTRSMAADLGVSNGSVAAVWRAWGIVPTGDGVRFATEPPLVEPLRDVVGLLVAARCQVLAVAVGGEPARAVGPHPDLVARLAALAAQAAPAAPEPDPAAFLRAVARVPGCRLVVPVACALPAGSPPEHVATPGRWPRIVHAAAALVGGPGVAELVAALDAHLVAGSGAAFAWPRTSLSPDSGDN
jgi:transposase